MTPSFQACPRCGLPTERGDLGQPMWRCKKGHRWWAPNSGPQTKFLQLTCFEALYGGAAGGGKSLSLLVDATRYIGRGYGASYHALLLGRTFADLQRTLIKDAWALYPHLGGEYNQQLKIWRFPGGELIEFGHMQNEEDFRNYDGAAYQFVGFDELTHFTETQYVALMGRLRSSIGVRCRIRGATNPGGPGHEWVFKRWGAWLDPEAPVRAGPAEELWFSRDPDGTDRVVPAGTRLARSRTFVPARLEDNPSLYADGEYEANLQQFDPVRRAQLRSGNWLIKPAKGLYFRRDWFRFCDAAEIPRTARRCRYWDRAATEAAPGKDPDWTVGAKCAYDRETGHFYVEDIARMRGNPGEVERFIRSTAEMDGTSVPIGLEQEPGASGKAEVAAYIRLLNGWRAIAHAKRVNKIVAAGPVSAQTVARNVYVVRAPWNEAFVREAEQFPEGSHDDQIDAVSGAHTFLAGAPVPNRNLYTNIPQF